MQKIQKIKIIEQWKRRKRREKAKAVREGLKQELYARKISIVFTPSRRTVLNSHCLAILNYPEYVRYKVSANNELILEGKKSKPSEEPGWYKVRYVKAGKYGACVIIPVGLYKMFPGKFRIGRKLVASQNSVKGGNKVAFPF